MDNTHTSVPLITADPFQMLGGKKPKFITENRSCERRKVIAAQLLQGMLANSFMVSETWEVAKEKAKGDHGVMNKLAFETLAQFSIQAADILITELEAKLKGVG